MNKLQDSILANYRSTFPNDTLKEISRKTKIQITRVFRILNGSEMKISEYEAFEQSIDLTIKKSNFHQKAKECVHQLSQNRLNLIYSQMCQALKLVEFTNSKESNVINLNNLQLL